MDKEHVVHIHNGIPLSHKKSEIMPFAATWTDPEIIILSEVNQRNLYAGQEATVRNGHGTIDWFQMGKGVHQGCILSPCLFNLYAEYIMQNAGLDEAQAGITIARRNINNIRYADETTLMAENKEELKNFLMKLKEESENAGLKLNTQKTMIMASCPITSWQIDGETMETVRLYFGSPESLHMVTAVMKLKDAYSFEEKL